MHLGGSEFGGQASVDVEECRLSDSRDVASTVDATSGEVRSNGTDMIAL